MNSNREGFIKTAIENTKHFSLSTMSQQSKAPPAPRPTDLEQLAQRQDHLKTQCENERKELSKANNELRRLQETLAIKKQQVLKETPFAVMIQFTTCYV